MGVPVICCPPASECWPELGADAEAVLRRARSRRRWQYRALACSGEDNLYGSWCFPPGNGLLTGVGLSGNSLYSCKRMLAGAGTSAARSSSTSAALSELTHAYSRLLRRGHPLRELVLSSGQRPSHRSWASGNPLSSCGRMLAGASASAARSSSTSAALSELTHPSRRLLRRSHLLSEELDFAPVAGTILFA